MLQSTTPPLPSSSSLCPERPATRSNWRRPTGKWTYTLRCDLLAPLLRIARVNVDSQDCTDNRWAQVLGDDAPHSDYEMVASHYESTKDYINAGAYYIKCRKYATAVNLLLQDLGLPDDAGHIDLAIDAVGKANDDALTHQVIQYLLGATSDGSKEASYLFKLYMALKRFVVPLHVIAANHCAPCLTLPLLVTGIQRLRELPSSFPRSSKSRATTGPHTRYCLLCTSSCKRTTFASQTTSQTI